MCSDADQNTTEKEMVDLRTEAKNTCKMDFKDVLKICNSGFYWPVSLTDAIVYFPLRFIVQSFSY